MAKVSLFRFVGEIRPTDRIPPGKVTYQLQRSKGGVEVELDGPAISISFIDSFETFEDVYSETVEFISAFLSVQALRTGMPVSLVIHEWTETPLEPLGADGISHPVRGRVYHEPADEVPLPQDSFMFALAEGMRWAPDIDANPFLRRAILDFNYALQHPLNDVPIYLSRAIESAEAFFGGERQLVGALHVERQVKLVKRLANDAQSGVHARHAAVTPSMRRLSQEEVVQAVVATREILQLFQLESMVRRERGSRKAE